MRIKKNELIKIFSQSIGSEAAKDIINKNISFTSLEDKETYTLEEITRLCTVLVNSGGLVKIVAQKLLVKYELKRSEEQTLLLDNIRTMVWFVTKADTYGAVNKAFADFVGKKKEEIEGNNIHELMSNKEASVCIKGNSTVFKNKKQVSNEEIVKNIKGEKRILLTTKTPKLDDNGEVEYVICTGEDITERKKIETALKESEEKYRTLTEAVADTIYTLDINGNFSYINPQLEKTIGYCITDLIGKSFTKIIAPEYLEYTINKFKQGLSSNTASIYDIEIIHKQGHRIPIEVKVSTLFDDDNNPIGRLGIARDITERKLTQDKYTNQLIDLIEIGNQMRMELNLDNLLQNICNMIVSRHGWRQVILSLRNYETNTSKPVAMAGYDEKTVKEILSISPSPIKSVKKYQKKEFKISRSFYIDYSHWSEMDDYSKNRVITPVDNLEPGGWNEKDILLIPIEGKNNILGFISPDNPVDCLRPLQEKIQALEILADQAAVAIENAKLFEKAQKEISERKTIEKELRESENKYRTMIEHSNDLIWTLNKDGNFLYFNKKAEEITGYKSEFWINKSFTPIIYPKDLKIIPKIFIKTLNGYPQHYEVRIYDINRKLLTLSVNTAPMYKNGKVIGTVSFGRDITENKQAVKELASEKERLAVTLSSIGDAVITTNTEGKIILFNQMAENLTAWKKKNAVGNNITDVFDTYDDKIGKINPVKEVLESGKIINIAPKYKTLKTGEGFEKKISYSAAPIIDKENIIIGVVLVFHDITNQLKIMEELEKTSRLESLGILAGGIAHDFNNLLTAILGNISISKMYQIKDDNILEVLSSAEKAAIRAKGLTQQLLTFSKGGIPIKKVTSISDLIKESISFSLGGSKSSFDCSIQEDLWEVKIDEGQISQVLNNLIINADQSMINGGLIKVTLENIILDNNLNIPLEKGKYVKISIKDQGSGISKKNIQKIFDPFYTDKLNGTGLGLSIAYSIINKHNGYIDVESKVNYGTTFYLFLPASKKIRKKDINKKIPYNERKGKILLMDDETILLEAISIIIKKIGYEVELAKDGSETIKKYLKAIELGKPFDIVILDLTIPGGMGGKKTIEKLLEINPDIKAIVSSGYSTDPVMSNFTAYGFCGVLAKPYDVNDLNILLYEVMKK